MTAASRALLVALVVAGGALAACERRAAEVAERHETLGGDVVARVGSQAISPSLVADVARAKNETPQGALGDVIGDALFAEGARARGLDRRPDVARDLSASEARTVMLRLRAKAAADGPPTDTEVEELTRLHWTETDTPEQVEVIHAIAMRPKKNATDTTKARAVAAALEAAVLDATSQDDFEARANAVPHDDVDVRVERLPPFVADGRIVSAEDGSMDATFVAAAFALASPGATSKVIETSFGWHVIRLVKRIPPHRLDLEARRAAFAEETRARRARRAYDGLVGELRRTTPIEIDPGAEQRMGEVTYGAPRASAPASP